MIDDIIFMAKITYLVGVPLIIFLVGYLCGVSDRGKK